MLRRIIVTRHLFRILWMFKNSFSWTTTSFSRKSGLGFRETTLSRKMCRHFGGDQACKIWALKQCHSLRRNAVRITVQYILLYCLYAGDAVFSIYARRYLSLRQTGKHDDEAWNGLPKWNCNVSAGAHCWIYRYRIHQPIVCIVINRKLETILM